MFTFRRNWVITFSSPRVTARNPLRSQPKTFNWAMDPQCFHHVMRTGRFVSTVFRENGRDKPLIKLYQYNQRKCDDFVECAFQNSAKIN